MSPVELVGLACFGLGAILALLLVVALLELVVEFVYGLGEPRRLRNAEVRAFRREIEQYEREVAK